MQLILTPPTKVMVILKEISFNYGSPVWPPLVSDTGISVAIFSYAGKIRLSGYILYGKTHIGYMQSPDSFSQCLERIRRLLLSTCLTMKYIPVSVKVIGTLVKVNTAVISNPMVLMENFTKEVEDLVTPPARRAWRSYKFARFCFFLFFPCRKSAHR